MSNEEDTPCALILLNILNPNRNLKMRNYWIHTFWCKYCRGRGAFLVFKDLEDGDQLSYTEILYKILKPYKRPYCTIMLLWSYGLTFKIERFFYEIVFLKPFTLTQLCRMSFKLFV